jgi:5-methyltetrahydropteroyltriglutamate--homocysteine methyltransferase
MTKGKDDEESREDVTKIEIEAEGKGRRTEILSYATGIYPRSSSLITATRRLGSNDPRLRELFLKGKKSWINTQRRARLNYISDPMIDWDDIFRPFSKVRGIELGALNRFFETNTFYRRLIVKDALDGYGSIVYDHLALDLIDTNDKIKEKGKRSRHKGKSSSINIIYGKVVCMPDPYTFAYMNENTYYKSYEDYLSAIADMLNAEAKTLAENGVDIIQLNSPALAYNLSNGIDVDLSMVKDAIEKVKRGVRSKVYLYLYFGNVSSVFNRLIDINVDGIGFDATSTRLASILGYDVKGKDIVIGILDAMNTRLEDAKSTAAALDFVIDRMNSEHILLTVSNSLEFLPYRFALKKLSLLGNIARLVKAKQNGVMI